MQIRLFVKLKNHALRPAWQQPPQNCTNNMSAPPEIRSTRWTEEGLPSGLVSLARAAQDEGYLFLARLKDEWASGAMRFAGPGECLFVAVIGDGLVGIGGICRDPYLSDPNTGRLRHVYVDKPFRSRGIARGLVRACLACSGTTFRVIRLSTSTLNPMAGRLYEQLGFQPVAADGERVTHIYSTKGVQFSN
jgi:GNAT superfamily N-acetyltransferase